MDVFGHDLEPVETPAWPHGAYRTKYSRLLLVQERNTGKRFVHKARRTHPIEHDEIEEVLSRLQHCDCRSLCEISKYRIEDGEVHLLLQYVEGLSLSHCHDQTWRNEPRFQWFLQRLPLVTRLEMLRDVLDGLVAIHAAGLLFQDLKLEQVVVQEDARTVLVDLDSTVLIDGKCAAVGSWASRGYPKPTLRCSVRSDLRAFGWLAYELLTGNHPHPDDGIPTRNGCSEHGIELFLNRLVDDHAERGFATAADARGQLHAIQREVCVSDLSRGA